LKVLVGWGFVSYRVFCMSYQSDGECDRSYGGCQYELNTSRISSSLSLCIYPKLIEFDTHEVDTFLTWWLFFQS
jgi:hypothetical protein